MKTKFEFVIHQDKMVIRQDGREIGATALRLDRPEALRQLKITWGQGVFGPTSAQIVAQD